MSTYDGLEHDSERFTAQLSALLDDELAPAERTALEAHLRECESCRETYASLRRLKDEARAWVGPPAPDDLWAGIESQLGSAGPTSARVLEFPRRRAWYTHPAVPQLAAAGIALLLVAAGAVYLSSRGTFGAHTPAPVVAQQQVQPQPSPSTPGTQPEAQLAEFDPVQVEGEIAALKRALVTGKGKLDPKTIAVLEKNLRIIEQATEDAKAALAKDPHNKDLQEYFATSVKGKLELMRRATQMAGV